MRQPGALRLAPVLLVLLAVVGLIGAGQGDDGPAATVPDGTTALWATPAGIEAVLPAKLETAFERSALASSSKQALAVLVPPLLVALALARRAMAAAHVPKPALLWSPTLPERGPPLRRFALT
jgi:hypothetical protein